MVNHIKRVQDFEGLEQGEQVRAALFVQPSGNLSRTTGAAAGGLVGAGLGALLTKRKKKQVDEGMAAAGATPEGKAQQVSIQGGSYLAITDKRWVVLSQGLMSGKPKDLVTTFEHGEVTAVDLDKGKLMGNAMVRCDDGSAVALELPRGNDLDGFAAAAGAVGCAVTIS